MTKSLIKLRRKRILREMRYPNTCFCTQDGLEYNPVEYLRTEIWKDINPYAPRGVETEINIYRCGTCGKEVSDCPAFA